jgi:hypothetical protein
MIGVLSDKLKTRRIMKKTMFMFAAALMMAACSNEDVAVNDDVQYVSELKVNFGGSRVAVDHSPASGLTFAWQDGDVIEVREDLDDQSASGKILEYDATAGCFKAQNDNNTNKLEVGKKYFAVTGLSSYFISVDGGKSVAPLEFKNGTGLGKLPMITDVFEATAENTTATMYHTVGVVEIPVKAAATGVKLQQLGLKQTNPAIRGEFRMSPGGLDSWTNVYGYFDSYNQTSSDPLIELSNTKATSIFIPAWPNTYTSATIAYTLEGGTEKTITTAITDLTVVRGKITKVSEVTLE